jgi:hypothetical protein
LYAPLNPGPIACKTKRVVQSENITWRGTRSASQNVPLSKRLRTGGKARELDITVEVAELTESFLGGGGVDTPSALQGGGRHILAVLHPPRKANSRRFLIVQSTHTIAIAGRRPENSYHV